MEKSKTNQTLELAMKGREPEQTVALCLDNWRNPDIEQLSERFVNLEELSLVNVGLQSLKKFPKLESLKKLDLSDNFIANGLENLLNCPNLKHIQLNGNKINDFQQLECLKELKNLTHLDLFNCGVTDEEGYRQRIFAMIPQLKYVDGVDANDEYEDSDAEYDVEDEEEEEAEDEDQEDEERGSDDDEEEEEEEDEEEEDEEAEVEAEDSDGEEIENEEEGESQEEDEEDINNDGIDEDDDEDEVVPEVRGKKRKHEDDDVLDHYENPRNVGSLDKSDPTVGTGVVGAPACGDVMKLQIKVDENGRITDAKFKTFGCCSAIASSSLATEWIKGKSVEEALQVKNHEIAAELRLPPVKIHCSILAEEAISAALNDYRSKQKKVTGGGVASVLQLVKTGHSPEFLCPAFKNMGQTNLRKIFYYVTVRILVCRAWFDHTQSFGIHTVTLIPAEKKRNEQGNDELIRIKTSTKSKIYFLIKCVNRHVSVESSILRLNVESDRESNRSSLVLQDSYYALSSWDKMIFVVDVHLDTNAVRTLLNSLPPISEQIAFTDFSNISVIQSNGTYFEVELNNVIGDVKVGNQVWFRNPYNGNYNRGVIKVVKDKSDYTVVGLVCQGRWMWIISFFFMLPCNAACERSNGDFEMSDLFLNGAAAQLASLRISLSRICVVVRRKRDGVVCWTDVHNCTRLECAKRRASAKQSCGGCAFFVQQSPGGLHIFPLPYSHSLSVYCLYLDFDDGDEQTLRRHQLCLRASSSPAPMESQVRSDAGSSGARVLQFAASSGGDSGTSTTSDVSAPVDANLVVGAVVIVQRNLPDLQQLIGESVDLTNQCFPALVVTPSAAPHLHCQSTTDHVVRSFITGELSVVTASEVRSIDEWQGRELESFVLRRGLENAKVYLEQGKLPCGWDKDVLLAAGTSAVRDVSGELSAGEDTSKTTESSDVDSEEETNDEDRDHFVACLYKFMDERNTPINKCPMLAGKDLDLYHFYRKVMRAGGYTRVNNKNLWKVITDKMSHSLGVNLTVKSVRVAYESFLLSFENFTRKLGFPFKQYTPVTPRNATSRNEKEWMRSKALAEKIQAGDSTSASRKRKKYAEGGSDEAQKESGQKTAGGDGGSGTVAEQQQKKPSGDGVVVKVEAHPSDSKKLRLVVTGDKHKTLAVVKALEPNGGDGGGKAKAAATTVGSDDDGGSSNAKKQLKRTGDGDDGGVESVKKKLKPAAKVGKGKEITEGKEPAAAVPAKRGQTTAIGKSKSLRSKHVVTAESTSVVSDRVTRAKQCSVTVGASGTRATMASASLLEELSNTNAEVLLKDNKLESSSGAGKILTLDKPSSESLAEDGQLQFSSAASAVSAGIEQGLATNGTSKTKSDTENAAQIVVDETVMDEKKDQWTEQLMEMMPPAAVVEEEWVVAESGDHEQAAVADKAEALNEETQNNVKNKTENIEKKKQKKKKKKKKEVKGKKSKKKGKKDDDDDENKKEDGGDGVKVVNKSKKTHKVVKKKETLNEGKKVKDKLKKAGDKTAEGKKKGGGRKTAKKDGKEDSASGGTSGEGQKVKSSKAAKKKDVNKPGATTGAAVSKKKKKKTPKNDTGGGDVQGSNNDGNDNNDKPKKTKKKVRFADDQKDEKSEVKKKGKKEKKIAAAAAAGAKKKKKSTTAKVTKKKKKSAVTSTAIKRAAASNTSTTTTTAAPSANSSSNGGGSTTSNDNSSGRINKNTSSTNKSTSSGNTGKAASDASGAKGTGGATVKTAANGGASPAVVVGNKNVKNGVDNKIMKDENKKNKKAKKKKKEKGKKGKKDPGKRNTELKRVTVVNFKTGEVGMKSLKKKSKGGGRNKGKGKKKRIVPKKQPTPSSQPSKGQRKTTNVVVPQKKERNNPFKILQKFIPDALKIEFPSMYGDMDFKDVSLNMLEKEVDSVAENPQFDPTKVFNFEEEAVDIDSSERIAWLESQMQLFKAKFRDVNTKIKQVERLRRRAVRLYRAKDVPRQYFCWIVRDGSLIFPFLCTYYYRQKSVSPRFANFEHIF
ncbi:Iron-sulfur cluster assembly enzyme ISCU, mitochondrial [Trichinella patagoniensis]|uniref:Iron-sulfur cluster assembly enzyme ISCU n=1 Tax=Trichinella patagoniensis TaxID=990121 RepID=A0A0V1A6R9_9BILA|nr:Iron-sulfur cluster assembly enzyme ISCU, mitochondrial [Trichinella patagoniensis]